MMFPKIKSASDKKMMMIPKKLCPSPENVQLTCKQSNQPAIPSHQRSRSVDNRGARGTGESREAREACGTVIAWYWAAVNAAAAAGDFFSSWSPCLSPPLSSIKVPTCMATRYRGRDHENFAAEVSTSRERAVAE